MDSFEGYLLAVVIVYFLIQDSFRYPESSEHFSPIDPHSRRPNGIFRPRLDPSCSAPLCRTSCQH
jgi:hypothetical protein